MYAISKIASVTFLGISAALMTDVHQSTDAQKGNPPSRAHHQHRPLSLSCWKLENNAVFQEQALGVLPSLGELEAWTGRLGSAVPLVRGHRGPDECERRARLSAPTPRGSAARRRRGGETRRGRDGWEERTGDTSLKHINIQRLTAELPMHKYGRAVETNGW